MCDICCQPDCTSCNGFEPEQGEPGQPAFIGLNFMVAGVPFSTGVGPFVEAGRFVFSTDMAEIFTSFRANVWVAAGTTGSIRLRDLVSGTVIYTNNAVTSTSNINVEVRKALQVYNSTNAIISVQIGVVAGTTIFIGAASLAYEK